MMTEPEWSARIKAAGRSIPLRSLDYERFIAHARPSRRRYLAAVGAFALCGVGLLTVAALSIAGVVSRDTPIDPSKVESSVTLERARPVLMDFAEGFREKDAATTWDMLSPRSQDAVGSLGKWERRQSDVRYLFDWIGERPFDLYLTPLDGSTAVVTAAETEPDGTSWLLTTVTVKDVSGELLFDLDLQRTVDLTPEVPLFQASSPCIGDGPCPSPESLRPTISQDETLSVLLQPADPVGEVWFALGGDRWVARAELSQTDDGVRATATLDGRRLPHETVFVVAIARGDGGIDSYGYRVLTEP